MAFASTITSVLPRPRATVLAGRIYALSELRLVDLAELQAWLELAGPHPLAGLPCTENDDDQATRPARLRAAWRAAKEWPPIYGSNESRDLLASPGGIVAFVWLCLRRNHPEIELDEAAEVAAAMTAENWRELRRIAYGVPIWRQLIGELDPEWSDSPANSIDWGRAFEELSAERGWTYEQIGEMTLSQWRNYCTGGKPAQYRAQPRPGETAKQLMARQREIFGGVSAAARAGDSSVGDERPCQLDDHQES